MGTTDQAAGGAATTRSTAAARTTLFRWISAARYVVALALMVLIVLMIAHAIKVVGRERDLDVTVTGGSMTVMAPRNPSENFSFGLTIQAFNPSGMGQVYYTNVRVSLAGKISSSSSPPTRFFNYRPGDMAVLPRVTKFTSSIVLVNGSTVNPPDFRDYFIHGNTMRDGVLRINGTLQTELYSGYNTTGRMAVYCCEPIVVGDVDEDNSPTSDIICTGPESTMVNCEMI